MPLYAVCNIGSCVKKKKKKVQLLDVCYICIVLADTGVLNEQYFKTDMEMEPVERERKNRDFNSP